MNTSFLSFATKQENKQSELSLIKSDTRLSCTDEKTIQRLANLVTHLEKPGEELFCEGTIEKTVKIFSLALSPSVAKLFSEKIFQQVKACREKVNAVFRDTIKSFQRKIKEQSITLSEAFQFYEEMPDIEKLKKTGFYLAIKKELEIKINQEIIQNPELFNAELLPLLKTFFVDFFQVEDSLEDESTKFFQNLRKKENFKAIKEEIKKGNQPISETLTLYMSFRDFERENFDDLISTVVEKELQKEPIYGLEVLRTYIVLRSCDVEKENHFTYMHLANVTAEFYRYKFASHFIKQNQSDGCVDQFGITNEKLNRRLAEKALCVDFMRYISHLIEFNFWDNENCSEFYLRGLSRSTDVINELSVDSLFMTKIPKNVLEFIYETFHFGRDNIRTYLPSFNGLTESQLFASILSESLENSEIVEESEELEENKEYDLITAGAFIESLEPREQPPFLAIMLFLDFLSAYLNEGPIEETHKLPFNIETSSESLDKAFFDAPLDALNISFLNLIKSAPILEFLKEIESFPEVNIRFALAGLVCNTIKKTSCLSILNIPFIQQNTKTVPSASFYPTIYLILFYLCESLKIPKEKLQILANWKDKEFRNRLILVMAELFFSEKLEDSERREILMPLVTTKDKKLGTLQDLFFCLRLRFIKQLKNKEDPTSILNKVLDQNLKRLGSPYNRELSFSFDEKMKDAEFMKKNPLFIGFAKNVGYYIQGLERLPTIVPDEKKIMVPFFFDFLELVVAGKIRETRYAAPELQDLFSIVDVEKWQMSKSLKISDLIQAYPDLSMGEELPFSIQQAFKDSFQHGHWTCEQYSEFHDHIFDIKKFENISPQDRQNLLTEESRIKLVTCYLVDIYTEVDPIKQIPLLGKLLSKLDQKSDFFNDITQWKKTLEKQATKKRNDEQHKNYTVLKCDDPYILFSIGSVAGESCQRVTGDSAKNKCLLAYPCDGKNQVIYVQDEKEIKARVILRFFDTLDPITQVKQKPVLYLESFYPSGISTELRTSMTLLAIQCAKELNVCLVRHLKKNTETPFPYSLVTIKGPAPFEYFDGTKSKILPVDNGFDHYIGEEIIGNTAIALLFDPATPTVFSI